MANLAGLLDDGDSAAWQSVGLDCLNCHSYFELYLKNQPVSDGCLCSANHNPTIQTTSATCRGQSDHKPTC